MSSIELNIDGSKKEFILKGNINALFKNYRAKSYFADFLKASFNENNTITIPFEQDERESTLKKIQDSLTKYGLEQSDSVNIKEILESYYKEKESFKEFSKKAKGIWNNIIDLNEFEEFKNVLEKTFPKRILYPQQLLASFHLAFSQNSCNFSVPGAGKTSIVYGAYAYLKSLPESHIKHVDKLLIIGPLSSFGPWEDEFEECFGYPAKSKRLSGGIPKEERDKYFFSIEPTASLPELTLMSYQSVSYNLDGLRYYLEIKNKGKVMVVLDEAHKIKNTEGGVWAQSILSLSKYCGARVVLTGTPVPNGFEDIYNLYQFIWPEKDIINFTTYQLKDMSNNRYDPRIEQLIDEISPFFIRIKKKDILNPKVFPVINLPPIHVKMGDVQREIYDFIENKYIGYFTDNNISSLISAELSKARFIRLMQAATNPSLLKLPLERYFKEEGLSDDLYIDDTEVIAKILQYKELESIPQKFLKVKEIVSQLIENNEKVIIWGTFIQNIKELKSYLADNDIESRILIGETPIERDDISMSTIETREKIIRTFHDDDSPFKVLIANPFAVSESISLHKACHHAIYLERTFNAANFIQSKDRIHRVGLEPGTATYYHYIVSKDSIDETIHVRLNEKEQRMLELIENQEIPLISANMDYDIDLKDDIKAIIRDYVRRIATV